MTVLKHREICKGLEAKGFVNEKSDHVFYHLYIDGKKTSIRTQLSHNKQDVDDYLIRFMKRQTKLTKNQFIDLIKCPLSKKDYINLLIQNGHVIK